MERRENQSEVHYAMVVRNMLYDAIDYASQVAEIAKINSKCKEKKTTAEFLSGLMKNDKIKPVITIVVYWGADEWDGARTLHGLLDADTAMLKCVPNYYLNLLVPAEIEDFDKFSTSLGLVMQCIKYSKDTNEFEELFEKNRDRFAKLQRYTAEFISELTNIKLEVENQKGDEVDMCEAIEGMMAKYRAIGEECGEQRGKEIDKVELIRINKDKMTVSAIASFMNVEDEYINSVILLINKFPDKDDGFIADRIIEKN